MAAVTAAGSSGPDRSGSAIVAQLLRNWHDTRDISKAIRNKYTATLAAHGAKSAKRRGWGSRSATAPTDDMLTWSESSLASLLADVLRKKNDQIRAFTDKGRRT
jgi:hypothetical protein